MEVSHQFEQIPVPSPQRKPSFPRKLLERDKFIDPTAEASVILPQQEASYSPILTDAKLGLGADYAAERKREGIFSSTLQYLLSIFESMKARLKSRRGKRARLTRKGEETLEQLRYLSLLCDATSCRTNEEVLEAEGAFGEAYYEIMQLSGELARMSQAEQRHHLHRYSKHMGKLLRFE
jgi:hypothetical protein